MPAQRRSSSTYTVPAGGTSSITTASSPRPERCWYSLASPTRWRAMLPGSGNGHSLSRAEGLQKAREAFYEGPVAQQIADSVASVGGIMSADDLAAYKSQYGTPVKTTFHGYEIYGQDTWTQGPALMQTLNMLENFDLRSMGHNSPAYIHTVAEAIKLSFGDREAHYGDPDFSTIPIDGLLSKDYAAERARLIDLETAYPAQPEAGDPWRYSSRSRGSNGVRGSSGLPAPSDPATADASAREGTTHVSAMDKHGNMVCGTISGGAFAKSVFFPELGCALSTRIEMFNCDEGHPNVVEPGKRPRTTLVNYIISKDGQPVMTVGCPGGDNQTQANVQLMLNVILFGMDPQQAVEAPRFRDAEQRQFLLPPRLPSGEAGLGACYPGDHGRETCGPWATRSRELWTAVWAQRCPSGMPTPATLALGQTLAGPATPSRCRACISTIASFDYRADRTARPTVFAEAG